MRRLYSSRLCQHETNSYASILCRHNSFPSPCRHETQTLAHLPSPPIFLPLVSRRGYATQGGRVNNVFSVYFAVSSRDWGPRLSLAKPNLEDVEIRENKSFSGSIQNKSFFCSKKYFAFGWVWYLNQEASEINLTLTGFVTSGMIWYILGRYSTMISRQRYVVPIHYGEPSATKLYI